MIEVVNSIRDNRYPLASSLGRSASDRGYASEGRRVAASLGFVSVTVLVLVLLLVLYPLALRAMTVVGVGFLPAAVAINAVLKKTWDTGTSDRLRRRIALFATVACVILLGVTWIVLHSGAAVGNIEVASNSGLFLVAFLSGVMAAVAWRIRQPVPVPRRAAGPFPRASRDDFSSHLSAPINPPPRPDSTRTE